MGRMFQIPLPGMHIVELQADAFLKSLVQPFKN
jgi:hypothetical protein